jgi:hypothetical protein
MLGFVHSEIEIGFLYCLLAQLRPAGERRDSFIQRATLAHDVAEEWIWKLQNIPYPQFADLTANLEMLKARMDDLR